MKEEVYSLEFLLTHDIKNRTFKDKNKAKAYKLSFKKKGYQVSIRREGIRFKVECIKELSLSEVKAKEENERIKRIKL